MDWKLYNDIMETFDRRNANFMSQDQKLYNDTIETFDRRNALIDKD